MLVPRTEKKTKSKKKDVHKNGGTLYNTLLAIYFNDYSNITDKKKKRWIKSMILVIYFLKVIYIMNGTKRMKKNASQLEDTISAR